jgi:hypothetical protein
VKATLRACALLALGLLAGCGREPAPVTGNATSAGSPGAISPSDSQRVELERRAVPVVDTPAPPDASFGVTFATLDSAVAPLLESVERARAVLRPDSGTRAADSAFLAFRGGPLQEAMRQVASTLEDGRFIALLWPESEAKAPRATWMSPPLEARGIRAHRPEGQTHFEVSEAMLLDRLGPYLTPGMQAYLRVRDREQASPTAADASLMISLDELAARMLGAEEFLRTYPDSPLRDQVSSSYARYLVFYLGGIDNRPAFDTPTRRMQPEWRRSLEAFAAQHGDTEAGRTTSRYLALLGRSDFTRNAEVDSFLRELWTRVR